MAENIPDSLRRLNDEMKKADANLQAYINQWGNLGKGIMAAVAEGKVSIDELYRYIGSKKSQKDALRLQVIVDQEKLKDAKDKIDTALNKNVSKVNVFGKMIEGSDNLKAKLKEINDMLRLLPKTPAEQFDFVNKLVNGDKKQLSELSKQRVKDEKNVQKIQEQTTAALQKRVELEERLKTLKPNGKAWRDVKAELEQVNKEAQNYLAKMGSLGTAGSRQLKAYEKAGLITNADKQQIALERQQIDLLRQRMQAEQQLNRLLLQRDNATLAGKTVSPRVADSISRLQERIDTIDKQRLGSYQNFTQTSLQRIEGMWQNHETALTNIKTQGAQSRQRVLDRQTADEQKAIEQQRKLAQRYAEIESLRNKSLGGKKFVELNQSEIAQWRNFSTLLADVKKQMDALEAKHPGSLAKGQSLQSTDALLQQTKDNIRQRDIEAKRQAAAEEKRIEREIAEEVKKAAKEKSDAERQRAELERQNIRDLQSANKAATQEADRLAKAQAKARSAEAKQTFKRTDAESVANLRKQAEIKQQIAKIDHDRQVRAKTNAGISSQQADAERRSYSALQSELSKLISQQKERERLLRGTTAQASGKIGGYSERLQTQEAQRFRQELEKIERQQKKNKQGLESMLPTIQRLASAFGVAFSVQGLVQFGKKLVETRGEFELQQVALRSILQNKQVADEIWDKTMQAALQSPFRAMQLTKYTKQLAAYRIETEKLFDTTKRLADVSAGLGVDMQRLILAYGQVKAANYLRASEIRQFTEAGVNILGELSTYLSKTRGEFISTAQVMEMVQKRMVTFADVEAIFKRMTDEGGIFYNMQYVQSQTVKGQLNKLNDAYDQMLNSIGKANQGALKDMTALLLNIVQNWREWKTAIDLIAFPVIFGLLIKFSRGLMAVNAAAIASNKSISIITRSGAKLNVTLKALGKTIASHPYLAMAAAAAAAGVAIYNHAKAVKEANNSYNELILRNVETRDNLNNLSDEVSKNNNILKTAKKGSDEYNAAKDRNSEILSKLTNDYPDLTRAIEANADGTINMTKALRDYNDVLSTTILLEQLSKGDFWHDDFKKNIAQSTQTMQEQQAEIESYRAEATLALENLEYEYGNYTEKEKKKHKEEYEEQKRFYTQIKNLNTSNLEEAVNNYNKIISANAKYVTIWGERLWRRGYNKSYDYTSFDFNKKTIEKQLSTQSTQLYELLKQGVGQDKELMKEVNKDFGGDIDAFIQNNSAKIQTAVNKGESDAFKYIRTYLLNMGMAFRPMQQFTNKVLNKLWGTEFDVFSGGNTDNTSQETPEEKQSKIDAAWRKRIQLLEEMRKRYEELSKSAYGYAKSNKEVRKAFADSFKDVFAGTGISMDQIDFTSMEAMMHSFELLKKKATAASKTVRDEIQKKADSSEAKIALDVEVKVREDFNREIEEMFNDYELTLEVQGLNIPKEAMKDLFPDADLTTLGDLQDRIQKFYQDRQTKDENGNVLFSEKDLETYRKWADKIDAEVLKARKERAKQYSKYLEKEYSERAKLEMQYARDVAFITANITDDTQRENILANVQKKYQNDLNELNWKSFKESDFYVEMMDDLASLPKDYMQMMLNKIEEILQHPETLSPRALKEAINARQKVLEAQMNIEPLDVMRTSLATINQAKNDVGGTSWKDTKDKIHEQIATTQQEIEALEEEARCWDATAAAMQEYENAAEAVNTARGKLSTESQQLISQEGGPVGAVTEYQTRITNANTQIAELESKKTLEPGEQDQLNALRSTVKYYETQISLLNELITKEGELAAIRTLQAGTDAEQQRGEGGVGTASAARGRAQGARDQANQPKQRIQNLKQYLKAFTNFDAAFTKFNAAINSTLNAVNGMGNAFYDMFDALGGKTDALTEGWKEFGNTMISSITNALTMIPMMVAAFTAAGIAINSAMGIIGLIAEALNLLMTAITAISKLHDAGYEKEIENQQKKIDNLKDAYERLEKQIEKTWTTFSYVEVHEKQIANIKEQIEALEAQRRAENAKKNTDEDKMREYEQSIQDAYDELEELAQKQIEVFGGIGEVNYRSVAEEFVNAWKDAFLETGDGLQGLQDHFDEFLQEWFVKQATMRIAGAMLEDTFKMIDDAVDQQSAGGVAVTVEELAAIRDKFAAVAPELSAALEELAGMWDLQGEGGLSGLAAGIQGMTEEQANILEAYWNSVRMYTANIDSNVARIADILGAGGVNTNPQLQQLQTIAASTQAMHQILQTTVKSGHPQGGYGFKVFND